jgi:poly-gamma-glutamate capsule biosynthesis protein CapA/YwtB (metallophosphatase superfamily)
MESFDLGVGNFEGVLVDKIGALSPDKSAMKVPVGALSALKAIRIKALSIANNHTMEYGPAHYHRMCETFARHGFTTFGHRHRPYEILTTREGNIGILGFSTIPAFYSLEPEYFYLDYDEEERTRELLDHVLEAKSQCRLLIVMPHWGYEFVEAPSERQFELARLLTSSGADIIAGAHPHVIQNAVIINHKPVVFSAGNFVSDYWQERVRKNLLVEMNTEGEQVYLHELHVSQEYVITTTDRIRPFDESAELLSTDTRSIRLVNRERNRVRREGLFHLLCNWSEVIRNYSVILWLLKRFGFIVKNWVKINKDPLTVYD